MLALIALLTGHPIIAAALVAEKTVSNLPQKTADAIQRNADIAAGKPVPPTFMQLLAEGRAERTERKLKREQRQVEIKRIEALSLDKQDAEWTKFYAFLDE